MSISLVQSNLGGFNNGTFSTSGGSTAATGTFGTTTTAGNLLMAIVYNKQVVTGGLGFAPTTLTMSGGGTWSSNLLSGGFSAGSNRWSAALFLIGNAPSISSATTLTGTVTESASSASGTEVVEFALYEFSGLVKSTNYNAGGPLVDTEAGKGNQTNGVPNTANLSTVATDLIVAYGHWDTGNISAGTNYTLGQNAAHSTFGQFEYQLNVPSGTVAVSFSGTSQSNWGAAAMALKSPAVVAVGVNQGMLIGF